MKLVQLTMKTYNTDQGARIMKCKSKLVLITVVVLLILNIPVSDTFIDQVKRRQLFTQ